MSQTICHARDFMVVEIAIDPVFIASQTRPVRCADAAPATFVNGVPNSIYVTTIAGQVIICLGKQLLFE